MVLHSAGELFYRFFYVHEFTLLDHGEETILRADGILDLPSYSLLSLHDDRHSAGELIYTVYVFCVHEFPLLDHGEEIIMRVDGLLDLPSYCLLQLHDDRTHSYEISVICGSISVRGPRILVSSSSVGAHGSPA